MKTLTNSKNCSGSHIIISVPASLSIIGQFSPLSPSYWMQQKSAYNCPCPRRLPVLYFRPQAGSCKSWSKSSLQSIWTGLLRWFLQFVSDFIKASRNFLLDFHHTKTAINCKNHQCLFKNCSFDLKEIILSSWHYPFKLIQLHLLWLSLLWAFLAVDFWKALFLLRTV